MKKHTNESTGLVSDRPTKSVEVIDDKFHGSIFTNYFVVTLSVGQGNTSTRHRIAVKASNVADAVKLAEVYAEGVQSTMGGDTYHHIGAVVSSTSLRDVSQVRMDPNGYLWFEQQRIHKNPNEKRVSKDEVFGE